MAPQGIPDLLAETGCAPQWTRATFDIDELGYLPIDQHGADLLFQVISRRYERGSIELTTNKPCKQWAAIQQRQHHCLGGAGPVATPRRARKKVDPRKALGLVGLLFTLSLVGQAQPQPVNLTLRSYWPPHPAFNPSCVAVDGNYANVAGQADYLLVLDIRDPTRPAYVSYCDLGRVDTSVETCDIQVAGIYAYVVRPFAVNPATTESRLDIFDLSSPTQPVKGGSRPTPDLVCGLQRVGSLLYAALGDAGVEVYDLSDPVHPVKVGAYMTRHRATGIQVVGNRVYALTRFGGMAILEVVPNLRLAAPVLSDSALTLSWNGGPGIKMQKTTSLTNPNWHDVPDSEGASQIELPRDTDAAFYRLIQPRS